MRKFLIKILFRLLGVDLKTKNLIPFTDLPKIKDPKEAAELMDELNRKRYWRALSTAYSIPYLNEYLYLQVTNIRNEHIYTSEKAKRDVQVGGILWILRFMEEMRAADEYLKKERLNK